jgi:ProP effector
MSETLPPTPPPSPTPSPLSEAVCPEATAAPLSPMTPAECAQQLRQLFPALFGGAVRPLKLRIQVDIQERAPGRFSKQQLSAFFRRHTGSTSYLIAVSKAAHRFDLDGQPSGEVSDEHRKVALDELGRRRANHESQRELLEQQRRNRAGLLHDFQITTLTTANFCALKGVAVEELEGLLDMARAEAQERVRQAPPAYRPSPPERPRRPMPPRANPRSRPPR